MRQIIQTTNLKNFLDPSNKTSERKIIYNAKGVFVSLYQLCFMILQRRFKATTVYSTHSFQASNSLGKFKGRLFPVIIARLKHVWHRQSVSDCSKWRRTKFPASEESHFMPFATPFSFLRQGEIANKGVIRANLVLWFRLGTLRERHLAQFVHRSNPKSLTLKISPRSSED